MLGRQAGRSLIKFIPADGHRLGGRRRAGGRLDVSPWARRSATTTGPSCKGHVPNTEDLKRYYNDQLDAGRGGLEAAAPPSDGDGGVMSRWRLVVVARC